jgi:3-hydroxyisobutyrate dehydrogenase
MTVPTENPTPSIAVLGLGVMGHAIAVNSRRAGLPTVVWNRTPERTRDLVEQGAFAADNAADAARRADIVVTMLTDVDAVLAVAIDHGMLEAMAPGALWVQMSTIGLGIDTVAQLVARRRPDVTLLDAPVSGSKGPAEAGTLTIFASGPVETHARVAPFFDAIGARTAWVGPTGTGSRVKLVNNTMLALSAEGVASSVALARRLGVTMETLLDALDGSPLVSQWADSKLRRVANREYSAQFALALALKDVRLALAALAADEYPVVRTLAAEWQGAVEQGLGDDDVTVVTRLLDEQTLEAPFPAGSSIV